LEALHSVGEPHNETVEVILRKGGDCNEVWKGETAWDHLRKRCNPETTAYKEITALFIKYGGKIPDSHVEASSQSDGS
jgi:hypothetical protein